jgi:hypothetical protein
VSDVITLSLRDTSHGNNRFLNGHTANGTVRLGPGDASGAKWARAFQTINGQRSWILRCQDDAQNAQHLFLDGHTQNGTMGLAPNTNLSFSGTHWLAHDIGSGAFILECLGTFKNPNFVLLDGNLANGAVGLVPNAKPPTGAHWVVGRPPVKFDDGTNLVPASD